MKMNILSIFFFLCYVGLSFSISISITSYCSSSNCSGNGNTTNLYENACTVLTQCGSNANTTDLYFTAMVLNSSITTRSYSDYKCTHLLNTGFVKCDTCFNVTTTSSYQFTCDSSLNLFSIALIFSSLIITFGFMEMQ